MKNIRIIAKTGEIYILSMTRAAAKKAEAYGFDPNATAEGKIPVTGMTALIRAAFYEHQPQFSEDTVMEIYADLPDKEKLIEELAKGYADCANTLVEKPKKGNLSWSVVE